MKIVQVLILLLHFLITTTTTASSNTNTRCQIPNSHHQFCNTTLAIKTRAQILISNLTLSEKIQQLSNNASSIPRLAIPAYQYWSESLHGIAANGPGVSFSSGPIHSATNFPQVILSVAAFNRTLWGQIAKAIGDEAIAMYNVGQAGLTFWAPNINVFRDPRWGRGQETPGEDPMVVSAYAIEYVKAFERQRGDVEGGIELSACCKHFSAYDLEKWGEFTRYNFNAVVTKQDMADTYQPPFKSCIIQGNASCLMCSYNSVNGIPACANHDLLQKARTEWNFRGYITSDCDAVATIYEYQNYTKSPEDAVAAALKAGTDINCGTYMLRHMKSAVEQGKVLEEDIDRALLNLFTVQLRLGLFDGESVRNRVRKLGPRDVCTSDHKKLALEAARQGIVLLKNDKKLLPLDKHDISSLAIIGPLANSTDLGGGYTGVPCNPRSILEEFTERVNNIYHATGCYDVACNSSHYFEEAKSIAKQAEYVIVVVGLDLSQETEDRDRYSLLLPGYQMALIKDVASVSKKPLILVLTGGGPVDVTFAEEHGGVGSIIWIGYPGETGGKALADIIFGHYNPGGRLPMTWYLESFTSIPMSDMHMRADPSRNYPGRTYRFYTGDRLYGFGHGLSYTKHAYKLLSAPHKLNLLDCTNTKPFRNMLSQKGVSEDFIYVDEVPYCSSLRFHVQISVTNTGDIDGSEVVLLFSKTSKAFKGSPEKQLIGFERINLLGFRTVETSFVVDPCEHLSFADEYGSRILPIGNHILTSGTLRHTLTIEM